MTFFEAINSGFSKYVTFSGRASRSEYWWFHLFYLICLGGVIALAPVMIQSGFLGALYGFTAIAVYLGFILPSISVGVRRLHDKNLSGWLYLIIFVPFGSFALLILFMLKGTDGPNEHGPDPLTERDHYFGSDREMPAKADTETYSKSSIPRVSRD